MKTLAKGRVDVVGNDSMAADFPIYKQTFQFSEPVLQIVIAYDSEGVDLDILGSIDGGTDELIGSLAPSSPVTFTPFVTDKDYDRITLEAKVTDSSSGASCRFEYLIR